MNFTKTYKLCAVILFFAVIVAFNVYAAGRPWDDDHGTPFDFWFENHFDTHQQSKIGGSDKLVGFFYIVFTGEINEEEGLPEAEHGSGPDSTVGWVLDGVPVEDAKVIENNPGEHPVWCLDPEDIPRQPGYTHFHWEGNPISGSALEMGDVKDGYLLKLTAIDSFVFLHGDDFVITPGIDYDSHENIVTYVEDPACVAPE